MPILSVLLPALSGLLYYTKPGLALDSNDAEDMWDAYNKVFLHQDGNSAFYQASISNTDPDGSWTGSYDIFVAEDYYQHDGSSDSQTLVNNLCATWLANNPPDWHWDGWNDDLGWFTLGLVRGYQATGNSDLLQPAMTGWDYAYQRGWNTTSNNGGIWEQNPEYLPAGSALLKEALSNDSLGKVACLIYQSTHQLSYLNNAKWIYAWVRTHIFDTTTGAVYRGVDPDGNVDRSTAAYNQGTFVDYANLLWKITGEKQYYDDAKLAVDFGINSLTVNGIFSNSADYLDGWADEFARGAGNFVHDNNLWDAYYDFFLKNANSILANRRSDLGITWNAWDQPTPQDNSLVTNKFIGGVSWLLYTPSEKPSGKIEGIRTIVSKGSGLALDSKGAWGDGQPVAQSSSDGGNTQRWLFSRNSDQTWNIVNLDTSQALTSSSADPGASIVQKFPLRTEPQRWVIGDLGDGTYAIINHHTGQVLDSGASLSQVNFNGDASQHWLLDQPTI